MAAGSIASQLQALKTFVQADSEPLKKPYNRPSLLYHPKDAADTDIDTIFSVALSGLAALEDVDHRFKAYRHNLFSPKTKDMNRELMTTEENNQINGTISSYLRLISGHLQLLPAFKTLEYLIRRYKIHVYNTEQLILCALPYHDTHAFVRIIQLLDLGNTRWKFLEGVKVSGAPPPRKIIVQQCLRDLGVMESICDYGTSTKKDLPSTTVTSFSTTLVIEVLGSVANIDNDLVMRILPFVLSGLQSAEKGRSDLKAGSLMIIGILANRVTLSSKVVKSLVQSVVELTFADAKESTDVQLFHTSVMALINIVQSQSLGTLPKKATDVLKGCSDLPGILSGLARRFNTEKFMVVLLKSMIEYSYSDISYKSAVVPIIDTVPIKGIIHRVVSSLLHLCLRWSQSTKSSELVDSGTWVKQILMVINKKYPDELRSAFNRFLEDEKVQSKGDCLVSDALCRILDSGSGLVISESRIWFALEHPKAEIRRATLRSLDFSGVVADNSVESQRLVSVQDAVMRRLCDDDLSVVQAALSLNKLPELIGSLNLLKIVKGIIQRCTVLLASGPSADICLAGDTCLTCLELAVSNFQNQNTFVEDLATLMFPLLLVASQTRTINLKALELAGKIGWPFYRNLLCPKEKSGFASSSSINTDIVSGLAAVFSVEVEEFLPWLVKCCDHFELSKTLFFLVLCHSFTRLDSGVHFSSLFRACFSILKNEWIALEKFDDILAGEKIDDVFFDGGCIKFLDQVHHVHQRQLNAKIIVFTLWKIVLSYISTMATAVILDDNEYIFRELFIFFAERRMNNVFKNHLHYLVLKCQTFFVHLFSELICKEGVSSAVQVESLHSLASLCSNMNESTCLQLLAKFPPVLIPLSSDIKDIRKAAMHYVEGLWTWWSHVQSSVGRNGNNESWSSSVDGLLRLLVEQKKLIISDCDYLPSLLASVLSSSSRSLMVPPESFRFEKSSVDGLLDFILGSAMKLPSNCKLRILSLLKDVGGALMLVKGIEALLCELLQRLSQHNVENDRSFEKLSSTDMDILCLLLEICCAAVLTDGPQFERHLLKALETNRIYATDPTASQLCITVLRKLDDHLYGSLTSHTQDLILHKIVLLLQNPSTEVQNAARESLLRLKISSLAIIHLLDDVPISEGNLHNPSDQKKKKQKKKASSTNVLPFLGSLLDAVLLKKDLARRTLLMKPLFELLRKVYSNAILFNCNPDQLIRTSSGVQQTILLILEDIAFSMLNKNLPNDFALDKSEVVILVECSHLTGEVSVLNHAFSLFTLITKIMPEVVLDQIPSILAATCKSIVTQEDSHSKCVFENLVSAVVPCWLSNNRDAANLLRIFVDVMPHIAQHRRLPIMHHLLRTLGEEKSLSSLFLLLLQSLVSRIKSFFPEKENISTFIKSAAHTEWEHILAGQICGQYSCLIWLPSLVMLLQLLSTSDQPENGSKEMLFAVNFILEKLHDPEYLFKLESEEADMIQEILGRLLEHVVYCLHLVDSEGWKVESLIKKELKERLQDVVRVITMGMIPSAFFKAIIALLDHIEGNVRKKALKLLCETVRNFHAFGSNNGKKTNVRLKSLWDNLDGNDSFVKMCCKLLQLVDYTQEEQSLKLAAVSAVEGVASGIPPDHSISSQCLVSIQKNILSDDLAVSSSCLRTTGALVNALGTRALPELPGIMESLLKRSQILPLALDTNGGCVNGSSALTKSKQLVMSSIHVTLEALVQKLGSFLNPYLGDIFELLVLNPAYLLESNGRLRTRAEAVRRLLSEKIPVRLALPPLVKLYPKSVKSGDLSLKMTFQMLASFISHMDRTSVSSFHGKIFDLCLMALDLRRQCPFSIRKVSAVEELVIEAFITLTMKLTENMFKPLFMTCIEWAESVLEEHEHTLVIDRAISFYGLVNKLAETHRSLFVPYFKYLVKGFVTYLDDDRERIIGGSKKKKARLEKITSRKEESDDIALRKWHVRALIISSLQKVFLYDTRSPKFLDSNNFQELLKPVVSQLIVEPPASLGEHADIPSVERVDDLLVSCIGQMAVTAGSDLLWKPLNYEVLMQTRSQMLRPRLLGLKVVNYLVLNLKEEYLVLLAETIPFLAELLEDAELSVKKLTQEILEELGKMSGEDLREYF